MTQQTYSPEENIEIRKAFILARWYADSVTGDPEEGVSNEQYEYLWQPAYDAKMRELGWKYTGDHCYCTEDEVEEGRHQFACGWTRVEGGAR